MSAYQTNLDHNFSDELFIFERMAGGDARALRFFFDRYYDSLCNYVNLYVHDLSVSEDIVQEIFIYFWEKREVINLGTSVKSYLFRASRNKYLNHLRNEKSHQTIKTEVNSNLVTFVTADDNILDIRHLEKVISSSVDKLPSRCREVYLLHRDEDLTYKEIAYRMDISVKTVENQMTIALKKLKEQLTPYYLQFFALFILFFCN